MESDKILSMNSIDPAESEWVSPIILVTKQERFSTILHILQRAELRDLQGSLKITQMDDCLESLDKARILSTLDANNGYWQIGIYYQGRENRLSHPTTDCPDLYKCV